jgi:hypothetical protein
MRDKKGRLLTDSEPPLSHTRTMALYLDLRDVVGERRPNHIVDRFGRNARPCNTRGEVEVVAGPAAFGDVAYKISMCCF